MIDIPVGMYRTHMNDIPDYPLPAGFAFRPFRPPTPTSPGDVDAWVRVQSAAEAAFMNLTRETFENDFGGAEPSLADRSWFVITESWREVASITAWWWNTPSDRTLQGRVGLIHWVAVIPEYQGRKLGKAIMTKAMRRLAENHQFAYLNTATIRVPAIKVYLDFGFMPDMKMDRADEAWAAVRQQLKHPALANA
jgi:GNAT superfamily N-acetyltransferase